jgi:hypothetical protein
VRVEGLVFGQNIGVEGRCCDEFFEEKNDRGWTIAAIIAL